MKKSATHAERAANINQEEAKKGPSDAKKRPKGTKAMQKCTKVEKVLKKGPPKHVFRYPF